MTLLVQELAQLLRATISAAKGDDLERAQAAFRGMDEKQLAMPHGSSGLSRQRVLDLYRADRARVEAAQQLLESMLKERGL